MIPNIFETKRTIIKSQNKKKTNVISCTVELTKQQCWRARSWIEKQQCHRRQWTSRCWSNSICCRPFEDVALILLWQHLLALALLAMIDHSSVIVIETKRIQYYFLKKLPPTIQWKKHTSGTAFNCFPCWICSNNPTRPVFGFDSTFW